MEAFLWKATWYAFIPHPHTGSFLFYHNTWIAHCAWCVCLPSCDLISVSYFFPPLNKVISLTFLLASVLRSFSLSTCLVISPTSSGPQGRELFPSLISSLIRLPGPPSPHSPPWLAADFALLPLAKKLPLVFPTPPHSSLFINSFVPLTWKFIFRTHCF